MNKFLAFAMLLTLLHVVIVVPKRQRIKFLNDDYDVNDVPKMFWKMYDVLSADPSCKDVKIMSFPSQVHIRRQKIYTRVEIPPVARSIFSGAVLRLEFGGLREPHNASVVYSADLRTNDERLPPVLSQEAEDVVASGRNVEMSFDVSQLLKPTVQLRRKHFSAHLKITPAKKLLKADSLRVFLIVTSKDKTCSESSLPDLQGGVILTPILVNGSAAPSEQPQCRAASYFVPSRDVPVAFNVLRPHRIDIGTCEGGCDLSPEGHGLFSNHAVLKATQGKAYFSPCCAPSALRPVLVMGQEPYSNFVSILEVPNLRISSCICM